MSNLTLFNSSNVPAFARNNELSETAKALTGGTGVSTKRVSIKGGVFRLVAGGKEVASIEDRHLDVVASSTLALTTPRRSCALSAGAPTVRSPMPASRPRNTTPAWVALRTRLALATGTPVPAASNSALLWFWPTTLKAMCCN